MTELEEDMQIEYRTRAGLPIQLVDLRIVDEQMHDVPHDGKATGEVVVRAPWLTQGYLNDPENSEDLWRGGYLHTKDIGTIDLEGYLLITDRIKDVIKSGGEWISSLAMEDIISQHPGVSEVAVIAIPDEKWGERPLALIVLREESVGMVTEEQIKLHVKGRADQESIAHTSSLGRSKNSGRIGGLRIYSIDTATLQPRASNSIANNAESYFLTSPYCT
jgi:fatty-acyl-CoA synthase